ASRIVIAGSFADRLVPPRYSRPVSPAPVPPPRPPPPHAWTNLPHPASPGAPPATRAPRPRVPPRPAHALPPAGATPPPPLRDLGDEDDVHEIGRLNLEANLPVTRPQRAGRRELEQELAEKIGRADAAARARGARVVPVGHLPTITEELFAGEEWRAPGARY